MKRVCVSIIMLLLLLCDVYAQDANSLIILRNKNIEVGILPEVGGRIVLLRKPGLKNILKSDTSLWCNPEKQKPEISAFSDFMAFNGHITWVGPQSEWWTHQTLNMERNKAKADWPPDPYLIYGKNEVIDKTDTSIKMSEPESPISGVRLYKEISIDSLGRVTVTSTAENIRNENISIDLWMLTRLDGFASAYVPVNENGILKLVYNSNDDIEATPYKIINGYFTFTPSLPVKLKTEQVQEVHLYPDGNFLAGFSEGQMLLIRFKKFERKQIHPQHGLVELYNDINENDGDRLLELEVHGEYKTLAPGETMSLTETWELMKYDGSANAEDQISFLNDYTK